MKTQTRKVGVAGGFYNQLMGNNASEPKVGQGATILHYSDRSAYEVIEVATDGNSCIIRAMDCKYTGIGYGDEQYEYFSNPKNHTMKMVYSFAKHCWGEETKRVQFVKSLVNKLYNAHGFNWGEHLPNGLTWEDCVENLDGIDTTYKLIKGVTKEYTYFHKTSIIFGVMNEYRDPSF